MMFPSPILLPLLLIQRFNNLSHPRTNILRNRISFNIFPYGTCFYDCNSRCSQCTSKLLL
uniref:Uncharacterized protein n=1 Tax=Picea glauca TaxID=3330 RepID=A0A101LYL3_PICGL|nr:hypothetical protein ABT39_MTgene5913 [Picea glauca]QHR92054.1 hypothetical protein Q903MT_gene6090 [Picea sitchensis]